MRPHLHLPNVSSQSGGGGGRGDLLGSICPEWGVAPLVDPGTDCEDELLARADVPAVGNQEMDSELQSVFIDVVSLPIMITPVSEVDSALCAPDYVDAVIAPPAVSPVVIRPPTATTSAAIYCRRLGLRHPQQQWGFHQNVVHLPVAAVPEDLLLFNAAMTSQAQPETSLFPQTGLTISFK